MPLRWLTQNGVVLALLVLVGLGAAVMIAVDAGRARPRRRRLWVRLLAGVLVASSLICVIHAARYGLAGVLVIFIMPFFVGVVVLAIVSIACLVSRRPRSIWIERVALTSAVGAFLAAGYGQDDRGQWYRKQHLQVIQPQLAELRGRLLDYRKRHGRYPTNDEGLAALDTFPGRFKTRFYLGAGPEANRFPSLSPSGRRGFEHRVEALLRESCLRRGRPPTTEEELGEDIGVPRRRPEFEWVFRPVQAEVAIGRNNSFFPVLSGNVLSPWWLPYVYENRRGLSAGAFADSPADEDPERRYSVRVDDGIYVSSVGGQVYAEEVDQMWWQDAHLRLLGAELLVVAAVLVAIGMRSRSGGAIVAGVLALIGSGLGGVGSCIVVHPMCYAMSPLFCDRSPQMVARRKALLTKYRATGVISAGTYQKALDAMDPPATQPTTAPVEDEQ